MNTNAKTQEVLNAIAMDTSATIIPASYSWAFGRSVTSAAFKIARKQGLIEVAYTSTAGTPVYRKPARPADAIVH